ncbi:hypothetical protein Acr_00g0047970 [Actinidia rufa]|uniref:Uncharacterized protein n=1 Tax=Actinidia rufa TaxID=165716 RepID=A0A7J0DK45_9ERIC|nr:hypothetical protein Acr_00g0047970 [Actinidia rufa]
MRGLRRSLIGGYLKGWKKKFFFISGDDWEFAYGLSRELGVLRVLRSWSTPDPRCNMPPVLTESEQESFSYDWGNTLSNGGDIAKEKILATWLTLRLVRVSLAFPKGMTTSREKGIHIGKKRAQEEALDISPVKKGKQTTNVKKKGPMRTLDDKKKGSIANIIAIDEFKVSDEYKEAIEGATSSYFLART